MHNISLKIEVYTMHLALYYLPKAGERPKKTWRTTFKENLQLRGISWCEVEAAAAERIRWQYLSV